MHSMKSGKEEKCFKTKHFLVHIWELLGGVPGLEQGAKSYNYKKGGRCKIEVPYGAVAWGKISAGS